MSSVSADIVTLNTSTGEVNLLVTDIPNDVFDIPDFVFNIPEPDSAIAHPPADEPVLAPARSPSPTLVHTLVHSLAPAPAITHFLAPSPSPAPARSPALALPPAPALVHSLAPAFIQNINNSALVELMRNTAPISVKSPTTISTRVTDISSSNTANTRPHNITTPLKQIHEQRHSSGVSRGHRHNKLKVTKIMVEDEYKDTSIDYDDDDPEVKKTKTSLFNFVKDIAFNLIFTIPSLRTKLKPILNNPALAINQIERIFDEFKDELNRVQLESIKRYVCVEGVRDKLNYILEAGFKKILADGKIDINDAPQFIQLVYFIIHSFNNINNGEVFKFAVSREHVMLLLHFILKSVFCLTLDGEEEQMAFGLVDTSFKLVKIEVCPLISKRWYHKFRICRAKKVIEDLVE
jgi:hypothetical protein